MFNSYSQPGGYGSFGTGYGSMYNSTMYGGYHTSPFGGASAGGYGIGNTNSFMRSAEESSRGAFQSIESVVHAFSAVSAMFESTYYAVYNSFRAVVGVADQFYRLKTHLSGFCPLSL
jgi:peroxin-13